MFKLKDCSITSITCDPHEEVMMYGSESEYTVPMIELRVKTDDDREYVHSYLRDLNVLYLINFFDHAVKEEHTWDMVVDGLRIMFSDDKFVEGGTRS